VSYEFYKKYRPKLLKEVVGQTEAVRLLGGALKRGQVPHSLLFVGPSGCGKTTLARIVKNRLECSKSDFKELNCADFRGVEMVRDIRARMDLAPMAGKCRVWLVDECHQLTKDAQNAFLKMLEDTPNHVYFFLCTTDPGKLLKTIQTRCTEVRVKALTPKVMEELVTTVASKERMDLSEEVIERLVEVADGSARKALVILNQLVGLEDETEQLQAINAADARVNGIEIARALLNPRTRWGDLAKILKGVDDEPESLRRMVLGYAANVMLGGGKMTGRARLIVDVFHDHFFDCGRAGLVASCHEVVTSK
jgi:DNA polymerase-3 subunit gamma/tau